MKTPSAFLACALATAVSTLSARAELFSPSTVGGAALGAVAGGVIGNNSGGHNGAKGAIVGAVAGGLLGAVYNQSRQPQSTYSTAPVYYPEPVYGGYTSGYGQPVYYAQPASRPESVTATSTLLGGVGGALIGHNNGGRTWQGALIGAGAGYLIGRVVDSSRNRAAQAAPVYYYSPQPTPAPQPPVTIINNNYYGTPSPMSSANTLFGR